MANETIRVEGLDDFRRALRKVDGALGKKIGQINKAAGQKVVAAARSAYGQHYRARRGRVPASIRASAAQSAAKITIGRATVPYALGQEFGSNRHPQFAPWTGPAPGGRGSRGRFFYPAIREESPKLVDDYLKVLDDVAREAFPK